ncbi:FAD-dependent oxidoreductase [Brevundimonas sp.]|uniref:FAD-dependent oxidoreductase n=1 Tax=Brevundimonas sp. TaxID=1871086 RepID=UPI003BAAC72A
MIDRRSFLNASAVAGAMVTTSAPAWARTSTSTAPDVAVVGAGAFGGWAALSLRERGLDVVSVDEYGPSNPRSASAGETRSIRSGYGAQGFYSAWAAQALELWKRRQAEFGRTLLYPNDRLELAQTWSPGLTAQREIFERLGIPYDVLDRAALRSRYPQMNFDDVEFAFLEKTSAAVIKAREAMIRTSEVFQEKGGRFQIARAMPGEASGRTLRTLALNDGGTLAAGQFVFACGPWSPKVFPKEMAPKVAVRRSEYYYWGVPPGDDRFSWPKQPAWHDHIKGGYGFGSLERGLKYSPSGLGGGAHDPDTADRLPTAFLIETGRQYIDHRFPGMRDAPILETRVCQTEGTADSHFVIDQHPDYDNVWIASGGGGHGFKFGPLLGEYIAGRVTGAPGDPQIDDLFKLSNKADIG